MLYIHVPSQEVFDDDNQEFVKTKAVTLQMEHSLVSIAKWESHWCIPWLTQTNMTSAQNLDYLKCMTITQNVPDIIFQLLTLEDMKAIRNYIDAPMSATTVTAKRKSGAHEIITSEIIYYWMIALEIPHEYEKWHLNRLLKLIEVCNAKNAPPDKMSKAEQQAQYRSLNAQRRAAAKARRKG